MDEARTETPAEYLLPRGVLDLLCPFGHIIGETQDRRWLWHINETLTRHAETLTPEVAKMVEVVGRYLAETCEHHWESVVDDDGLGEHLKCLWCETSEPKPSWFGK